MLRKSGAPEFLCVFAFAYLHLHTCVKIIVMMSICIEKHAFSAHALAIHVFLTAAL